MEQGGGSLSFVSESESKPSGFAPELEFFDNLNVHSCDHAPLPSKGGPNTGFLQVASCSLQTYCCLVQLHQAAGAQTPGKAGLYLQAT